VFDLFFVSYQELNAEINWQHLKNTYPHAKRIHGIQGIDNAHRMCAIQSFTSMFWTVDGDTVVDDHWNFDYIAPVYDRSYTHIWYSRNPINGLEYGYGAVKLWPRDAVVAYNGSWLDYTISVGQVKIMPNVIATTYFNTSPFETWKSAFRECVKLLHNINLDINDTQSQARLNTWIDTSNQEPYAEWCLAGAKDAVKWYSTNSNNLALINNFMWLQGIFDNQYSLSI